MNTETAPPFTPFVGQKIVCIDDDFVSPIFHGVVKKGDICIVEEVKNLPRHGMGILIDKDKRTNSRGPFWYSPEHFAPIQEQYADMTSEIAASLKETAEIPDTKVKEVCGS